MDNRRRKRYFNLINKDLKGKRILEIGPRDGCDTVRLDALSPGEIVLFELPSKDSLVNTWIGNIKSKNTIVYKNFMYLSDAEYEELGKFDLVYFAGVLYHNAEQLRFLRKLYKMLNVDGEMLLESATTRNPALMDLNVVEIHYPERYRGATTVTHFPSWKCIKSWLQMVGFKDIVDYRPDIRKKIGRYTCVAKKRGPDDGDVFYSENENNNFKFGDTT
jgi:tRNA (mo5U34)-methyltransferase